MTGDKLGERFKEPRGNTAEAWCRLRSLDELTGAPNGKHHFEGGPPHPRRCGRCGLQEKRRKR